MTAIQGRVSARASAHGKSISGAGRRQWRHQRSAFCPSLFSPLLPTLLSIFLLFPLPFSFSRGNLPAVEMPSGGAKLDQRFQALPGADRSRSRDLQTEEDPWMLRTELSAP